MFKKIRLRVNFAKLNESMKREKFLLLTTDQLLAKLYKATIFNKSSIATEVSYKLSPTKQSQEFITFITSYRRPCFTRLPFRISSRHTKVDDIHLIRDTRGHL